jgi:hypothetical protein
MLFLKIRHFLRRRLEAGCFVPSCLNIASISLRSILECKATFPPLISETLNLPAISASSLVIVTRKGIFEVAAHRKSGTSTRQYQRFKKISHPIICRAKFLMAARFLGS